MDHYIIPGRGACRVRCAAPTKLLKQQPERIEFIMAKFTPRLRPYRVVDELGITLVRTREEVERGLRGLGRVITRVVASSFLMQRFSWQLTLFLG